MDRVSIKMREMARDYMRNALMGTWAKIGKSKYQRCTGEVVEKQGNQWAGSGSFWLSAYAAMCHIDYRNNNAH